MDEAEFDDFYASSYGPLVAQLFAMIGNRDEAEECVQEAFVRAWAHRRSLSRDLHPAAWVRTTAYRLAVSRGRRVVRSRRPADRAIGQAAVTPGLSEDHVALVRALSRLPEQQRRALVLHHIADLPLEQVAAETGAPVGTVKARLSRGRTALAALLESQEEGASRA
jgi:RNA polymerase sigma-70 factor (ECF subfamily)